MRSKGYRIEFHIYNSIFQYRIPTHKISYFRCHLSILTYTISFSEINRISLSFWFGIIIFEISNMKRRMYLLLKKFAKCFVELLLISPHGLYFECISRWTRFFTHIVNSILLEYAAPLHLHLFCQSQSPSEFAILPIISNHIIN